MQDKIKKVIKEFEGLNLISGPKYRKDRDHYNEARELVAIGHVYYDCYLEFKGKKFPITFVPEEDVKTDLLKKLKEEGFDIDNI